MENRWIIYVVAIILLAGWSLFKGYKKGRTLYTIKKIINENCWIINILICMYIFIIGAHLVGPINDWAMLKAEEYVNSPLAYYIFKYTPFVFVVALIILVFKIIYIKWIPYNNKEKEWLKEDSKKSFNLRKYLSKFSAFKWMWKDEDVKVDKEIK